MRKIDMTAYEAEVMDANGQVVHGLVNVREHLILALFAPNDLSPLDLLARDDLARKIRDTEGETLLLDAAEYTLLEASLSKMRGLKQAAVEFVRRVLNAPEVAVTEALP